MRSKIKMKNRCKCKTRKSVIDRERKKKRDIRKGGREGREKGGRGGREGRETITSQNISSQVF